MRADIYLHYKGFIQSRQKAKLYIEGGKVSINGVKIPKPSFEIDENADISVEISDKEKYVSRGGLKLEAALDAFSVSVKDKTALDIGASTGGFTDCLLQNGALKVIALDSGTGQLHASIAENKKVFSIEKYNARNLCVDDIGQTVDIVVMDVSFISQTYIIPKIPNVLKDNGIFIGLIKPQFEVGRKAIGKNGIVKNKKDMLSAALRVVECASEYGLYCTGFCRSPILGGDGNIEYLAKYERVDSGKLTSSKISDIVLNRN